jgi:flagellar motor protein MotB
MKKALIFGISSLMMIFLLSSCETTQTPNVSSGGDLAVSGINSQVKGFSIDGFQGGGAKMDDNENLENMKNIVSIVKPIIAKVPDGYAMQIKGHCADYDSAEKKKSVSTARAKKVYDELKNAGADESKMDYKGVSFDEPLEGVDGKDPRQRRVSFEAIKK